MFDGIKFFWRDTQIKLDFPRYEREQSKTHRAEAERRFDIGQFQFEISVIQQKGRASGDQQFGAEITLLRQQIGVLEVEAIRIRHQLAIIERDYKSEIDALYARKKSLLDTKEQLSSEMKRLQVERTRAQENLNEAYEALENAQNDVKIWHNKSKRTPWLFGNGGKKLPNHSLFGQSFGDLDAAKSRCNYAGNEIGECKGRLAEVKRQQGANKHQREANQAEISGVHEEITRVKALRQRMFDLKKEGVRAGHLNHQLRERLSSKAELDDGLCALERQRSALVQETECRLGILERKAAVDELVIRKAQFLDEFHSDEMRAARLDSHRRQWLSKRGL